METYRLSNKSVQHFRTTFSQNGKGLDIDRYIYNQQGAGLGSFFANLFRKALPIAKAAINTAATVAKPHLQQFGKDLVQEGTRVVGKRLGEVAENPSKRRRKADIFNE